MLNEIIMLHNTSNLFLFKNIRSFILDFLKVFIYSMEETNDLIGLLGIFKDKLRK